MLWHPPVSASSAPDADKGGVEQALKDLVTALAASDRSRVQALMHPLVVWRHLAPVAPGRRVIFDENIDTMLASMARGQGMKIKPEESAPAVLGVDHDIASAKAILGPMPAYLPLARQDGKWRVVKKGSLELIVLTLLGERQRHGYEIGQLIESRSRGQLQFRVTSL